MIDRDTLLEKITTIFADLPYPGDAFLQGSLEGSEPYEEAGAFVGKTDWKSLPAEFLDQHYSALSFFSEAAFRFYLPAYLAADVRDELQTADPLFHLIHGFYDLAVEVTRNGKQFIIHSGRSTLVNPRRYGAMTSFDSARMRLSVFTRLEAQAIVAYLEYRRDSPHYSGEETHIQAALDAFWNDRAQNAPTNEDLEKHLKDQEDFLGS